MISSTSLDNYVALLDCSCSKKSFILLFKWNCLHPSFLVLSLSRATLSSVLALPSQLDAFLILRSEVFFSTLKTSNSILIYSFSPILSLLQE